MSCIVYQVDKKTGAKYAYESVSYWDKDRQQPRSKRKYIGKVDPETGEIIPKAEKHANSDNSSSEQKDELKKLYEEIKQKDKRILELENELKQERIRTRISQDTLEKIISLARAGVENV